MIQQIPSTNNFIRKEILDNIPSAAGLQQPTRVSSSALNIFIRHKKFMQRNTTETIEHLFNLCYPWQRCTRPTVLYAQTRILCVVLPYVVFIAVKSMTVSLLLCGFVFLLFFVVFIPAPYPVGASIWPLPNRNSANATTSGKAYTIHPHAHRHAARLAS